MAGDLFSTVTNLASIGYAGVGVVVVLLLFLIMIRGKPIDENSAKLYNRYLVLGLSFAAFSGVLSVVSQFLLDRQRLESEQARVAAENLKKPVTLTLTFAPDFNTKKLRPPRIKLADGTLAEADKPYPFTGGMVNIGVEEAMDDVEALIRVTKVLGANLEERNKQIEALAVLAPASGADALNIVQAARTSTALEKDMLANLERGNFRKAADTSAKLGAPAQLTARTINRMQQRPM